MTLVSGKLKNETAYCSNGKMFLEVSVIIKLNKLTMKMSQALQSFHTFKNLEPTF